MLCLGAEVKCVTQDLGTLGIVAYLKVLTKQDLRRTRLVPLPFAALDRMLDSDGGLKSTLLQKLAHCQA